MVVPTQQPEVGEVGEVGGTTVLPVPDVVRLAERGAEGAAGFGAVLVAGDEDVPLGVADVAGRPSDIEHATRAVHDHAADPAITRDPLQRRPRQPLPVCRQ